MIDAVFIHYGGEARKTTDTTIIVEAQVGEVSVKIEQQKNLDALITLKTRDFEEHGRIKLIGGQLIWDKIATADVANTPNENPTDTPNENPTDTPNTGSDPNSNPLQNIEIGDSVTYTTTVNSEKLSNWKVFYIDNEESKVYLIYGDYLPKAAIPEMAEVEVSDVNGAILFDGNSYDREEFIGALNNTNNFNYLLGGTLTFNGKEINLSSESNVWAKGTPDIELFAKSWNAKYSQNQIYYSYSSSGKEVPNDPQNVTFYSNGYYVGNSQNPESINSYYLNEYGSTGYDNTLYFPHISEKTDGYWLASLAVYSGDAVCNIGENGFISCIEANDTSFCNAIRPIICIPTSLLN